MRQYVSCIIPFYNESESLILILNELLKIKEINQIICVNDGSSNNLAAKVKNQFNSIQLVSLNKNQGKSNAIRVGLSKVTNETILLFDADLQNVKALEIQEAILHFFPRRCDLLIMENKGDNSIIDGLLKKNIFQSGKRLLLRKDLVQILKKDISFYELEVTINQYMIDHKKIIKWASSSSYNPHKVTKKGWLRGSREDISMTFQIIKHIGIINYVNQIRFFYKESIK